MSEHQKLQFILDQIEAEMRLLSIWSKQAPSEQALASREPFCVDTLSFAQWLQWVMIPRFGYLISQQLPLPQNCDIRSMAEEALKDEAGDCSRLVKLIGDVDVLLSIRH